MAPVEARDAQDVVATHEHLHLAFRPYNIHTVPAAEGPDQGDPAYSALIQLPYEILETVLLHLPIKDLLLCQRVCHRFRYMVASSKPLRRALFLEPTYHSGALNDWVPLKFNPFLDTRLAGSFNIRTIGVHRGKDGVVKMVAQMRYEKEALLDDDWAEILLYEGASWKAMLVTQPPATLLMHPSASLFWKTAMEQRAQFYRDDGGFTIVDALECEDW